VVSTRYVTTRGGFVLHLAVCPIVATKRTQMVPWPWAETRSAEEIVRAVAKFAMLVCPSCLPELRNQVERYIQS
jgi:hypothetical protein